MSNVEPIALKERGSGTLAIFDTGGGGGGGGARDYAKTYPATFRAPMPTLQNFVSTFIKFTRGANHPPPPIYRSPAPIATDEVQRSITCFTETSFTRTRTDVPPHTAALHARNKHVRAHFLQRAIQLGRATRRRPARQRAGP